MALFTSRVRTNYSPIGMREAPFAYYERKAGADGEAARAQLELWVSEIDPAQSDRVVEALKKVKSPTQFQEAFWELYLHHAFLEQGFAVEFEPEIFQPGRDEAQTPDLRVIKDSREVYVEATVVNEPGGENQERDVRQIVKEQINNRLKSPDFWLGWQVLEQGRSDQIKVTELVSKLENWLAGLDVQSVEANFYRYQILPEFEYEQSPWKIQFFANPIQLSQRGTPFERIIGLSMETIGRSTAQRDPTNIRDAIKKKGKKYEHLNAPLIVAVLVPRLGAGAWDIRAALFGGASISKDLLTSGRIEGPYRDIDVDGVWATRRGPAYPQVAAVITIDKHLEPGGTQEFEPVVWLNPWAHTSVHQVLKWPTMIANPDEGTIEREEV